MQKLVYKATPGNRCNSRKKVGISLNWCFQLNGRRCFQVLNLEMKWLFFVLLCSSFWEETFTMHPAGKKFPNRLIILVYILRCVV